MLSWKELHSHQVKVACKDQLLKTLSTKKYAPVGSVVQYYQTIIIEICSELKSKLY